jgi:hypothetical protein
MRWTRTAAATRGEPDRPGPALRVEPARVGGGRPFAGLVVAATITVALGLAILKPWSPPANERPAEAARVAGPSSRPTAAVRAEPRPRATTAETAARTLRVADWVGLARDVDHLAGQPIVSDRDLGGTDGDGTCGGSARITPYDELIAIVAPPGERVAGVRLFAIDSIRRPDVATRLWIDRAGGLDGRPLDGITVVALPPGGIAARQYALIAETSSRDGPSRRTYTICVT